MFADEARFGRMNRPRPCGAVCPKDGTCVFLILPAPDTECLQIFLNTLAKKYSRSLILLFMDAEAPRLDSIRYLYICTSIRSGVISCIVIHRWGSLSCAWRPTDSELHRSSRGFDFRKCQTVAASPAEPGELPLWF